MSVKVTSSKLNDPLKFFIIKMYVLLYQGYFRKGEVEFATEHFKEAMESYKVSLK